MKRKITGAILISLGLGLFWQALAQGLDCQTLFRKNMSNVVTQLTSLSIQSAA
jgi:hypothetical protein